MRDGIQSMHAPTYVSVAGWLACTLVRMHAVEMKRLKEERAAAGTAAFAELLADAYAHEEARVLTGRERACMHA